MNFVPKFHMNFRAAPEFIVKNKKSYKKSYGDFPAVVIDQVTHTQYFCFLWPGSLEILLRGIRW